MMARLEARGSRLEARGWTMDEDEDAVQAHLGSVGFFLPMGYVLGVLEYCEYYVVSFEAVVAL